jgi:hypothetical protein
MAARKALDTKNINLVLPCVPAEFEPEPSEALINLLSEELTHGIVAKLGHPLSKKAGKKEPTTRALPRRCMGCRAGAAPGGARDAGS